MCIDTAVGRLAIARVFGATLAESAELTPAPGQAQRAGALFSLQGANTVRQKQARPGDVIGIAKADAVKPGDRLGIGGAVPATRAGRDDRAANFAIAIAVRDL